MSTWVGASGNDARYTWPDFTTDLPHCQTITKFELTSKTGFTSTYPSSSCSSVICTLIDLDATYAHTETFKIHVITTYNAGTSAYSATITVSVQNNQPPSITMPSLASQTTLLLK